MDQKQDRMDMLKKLSFIGEKNVNIFNSYIPDHYDEIYTLYTLLDKANINYNNIEFFKPVKKGDSFVFLCDLNGDKYSKLDNFISEQNNEIKYMRNKTFKVTMKQEEYTCIRFSHM